MKENNLVLNLASYVSKVIPLSVKKQLYKSPIIANIIRAGLNKFAPEGLQQVPVAAGINESLVMQLDLQAEKDYWLGNYEPELQKAIKVLVKPGQIIYDVGANIGYVSLMFARQIGEKGHVYAFEALPENISRLRENIRLNGYNDRVTVVHAAVQDRAGEAEFLVGPSGAMGKIQGSAGRESVNYQAKIQVPGIPIDGFVEKPGNAVPDVIKIDVEGGEVLVFPGMIRLLQDEHPLVLLELHGAEAARVSWDVLTHSGYRICRMEPGFPRVEHFEDLDWKSYIVAFPDE